MKTDAVTFEDIAQAAVDLQGQVVRTPTLPAPALSDRCDSEIFVKLENQQITASFKARGAFIKLSRLAAEGSVAGVVAASAGNHAQGVAYHARTLGLPAIIVMPANTPFAKVSRTEALGAEVVLEGATLSEASAEAARIVSEKGYAFIHPYDDPDIIAGQGTVALEMLADEPGLEALVVPIGGGGLMAGMAVAAKTIKPDIRIIGVEVEGYASMTAALAGEPAPKTVQPTLAEGIAVKDAGLLTRDLIRPLVDEIVVVSERSIEHAVHELAEAQHLVVEGAGSAGWAAVRAKPQVVAGMKTGIVICGGNLDARLLASVLLRGLASSGRIARIRIKITDAPGTLSAVTRILGDAGGNIVEVVHQRLFHDIPVKLADLDVVVETRDKPHVARLLKALSKGGFEARVLSSTSEDEWL